MSEINIIAFIIKENKTKLKITKARKRKIYKYNSLLKDSLPLKSLDVRP